MSETLYQLFGLRIRSELPLPELFRSADGGAPDVEIRRGAVASDAEGRSVAVDGETVVLNVGDVARYATISGREIVVDTAPDASERNVRLFLLGSAMGALLHQRGLLPLHANAIVLDGRAIAFLGHSGAGKSTLAAWFHDRGHPILADDVCCVAPGADGRPMAYGGVPRLRLWRDALEQGGRRTEDYDLSHDALDKYDVPTRAAAARGPLPLAQIYWLAKAEPGEPAAVERLTGVAAVRALVANTYRGGYVRMLGQTEPHLAACLALARAVPVYRAARHWGRAGFDTEAERLERHARDSFAAEAGVPIP